MTTIINSQQLGLQQQERNGSERLSARVSSGVEKRKSSWFSWTKFKTTSTKVIIANPLFAGDKTLDSSKQAIEIKQQLQQHEISRSDLSNVFPKPVRQQSKSVANILVLGTEHSGSTSLAARFIGQRLCEGTATTRVVAHGEGYLAVGVRVVRNIDDQTFDEKLVRDSDGVVIVCDCSNPTISVYETVRWKQMLDSLNVTIPIILAVNKSDRASGANATFDQIKESLESNGVQFDNMFPVSALTGLNVEDCFGEILTALPNM